MSTFTHDRVAPMQAGARIRASIVMPWLLILAPILATLLACLPTAAWAQTIPSTDFSGFLCKIDLTENNQTGGVVYTLQSHKHCSGSPSSLNIFIDCSAPVPGFTGPSVTIKNVPCTIGGAACGVAGDSGGPDPDPDVDNILENTTNNKLVIDATTKTATLTCQWKGP